MNNAEQKAFFQQCLYTALMALMQEKKFEKISVGEICQRAGVSRMTYYRSYNNKEDILLQHLDECFAAFLEGLDVRDFYGVALSFFRFWQGEDQVFLAAVIRSGLSAHLMDKFYHYLDQLYSGMELGKNVDSYVLSFLSGGLYKMLIDWMMHGAVTEPEEMADFLAAGSTALMQK